MTRPFTLRWTELALSLGSFGQAPRSAETQVKIGKALLEWTSLYPIDLRLELFCSSPGDTRAVQDLQKHIGNRERQLLVARVEDTSNDLDMVKSQGISAVVTDYPASQIYADYLYPAEGLVRVRQRLTSFIKEAALRKLEPEISLVDIVRARKQDVKELVHEAERVASAYNTRIRWRLTDMTGDASPQRRSRSMSYLPTWIRWMEKDLGISTGSISVQCSNIHGNALENSKTGYSAGAQVVSSLFGTGLGCGFAASEAFLNMTLPHSISLKPLVKLREDIVSPSMPSFPRKPYWDNYSFELEAGTTPEALHTKTGVLLGFDPGERFGIEPEPVLTPLSGHAGILHLIHRHFPWYHVDTEDERALAISAEFERQFLEGRRQPVVWSEVLDQVTERGILVDIEKARQEVAE